MPTATYRVTGMTCEHCTRSVTTEFMTIAGVTSVSVDLVPDGASAVTVTSAAPLTGETVAAVLDEAGDYRLATG